jgi:hypothetical protein
MHDAVETETLGQGVLVDILHRLAAHTASSASARGCSAFRAGCRSGGAAHPTPMALVER